MLDYVKGLILEHLPAKSKVAVAARISRRDDDPTFRAAWALLEDDDQIVKKGGRWEVEEKVVVVGSLKEPPPPQLFEEPDLERAERYLNDAKEGTK
jgi:hypothetical protein